MVGYQIAGSYSERVSVVHIVGIPSAKAKKHGVPVHHSFADGDYSVFRNISKNISQASIILDDSKNAAKDIDRVLQGMYPGILVNYLDKLGYINRL